MKKYKQYHRKIWKWDFRPTGERASTRKGWRLYAYVPDPDAPEPTPAIAFLCYPKNQDPNQEYSKYLAGVLKEFLGETIKLEVEESKFKRQEDGEGNTVSICLVCYETIAISTEIGDVELSERTHECKGEPSW
jgi:hypothetical protein